MKANSKMILRLALERGEALGTDTAARMIDGSKKEAQALLEKLERKGRCVQRCGVWMGK